MRIASFNVENLFARAKALNLQSWAAGKPVLAAQAELNALLEEPTYTPFAVVSSQLSKTIGCYSFSYGPI